MLTKEDLQAIAGLLVPIETRIGNLESRFDKLTTSKAKPRAALRIWKRTCAA